MFGESRPMPDLIAPWPTAWNLTTQTLTRINGANARCLSHITGKSAHEEASARTLAFAAEEEEWVRHRVAAAAEAIEASLLEGVVPAMNRFNVDPGAES